MGVRLLPLVERWERDNCQTIMSRSQCIEPAAHVTVDCDL